MAPPDAPSGRPSAPEGYSRMGGRYMHGHSDRMMPMYGGYSRNDNKDMLLEHLQKVADMAVDEKDRKAVERLMSQMQDQ